ncbi:MAG TPA: hypothetical protein VFP61_07650 [Acidimicrobiales bacterium]|nr:hypothetical protein [Acidimicrobiales bacterium]
MAELDLTVAPPPPSEVGAIPPPPPDPGPQATIGVPDDDELLPLVDEATVRGLLASIGGVAGVVVGLPEVPGHWRFRDDELDQLAPPLARLANRTPTLRRALIHGDTLAVLFTLSQYGVRNVTDHRRVMDARDRARQGQAGVGVPGQPAHGGAGVRWGADGARAGDGAPGGPAVAGQW